MSQSFVERDHSFRKYAKFPKNQHFLPPDTLTCQFLGEFCVRTKWMIQKHYQWNSNEFFWYLILCTSYVKKIMANTGKINAGFICC